MVISTAFLLLLLSFVSFTVTTVYQVDLCNFFANLCDFQKSFNFFDFLKNQPDYKNGSNKENKISG